MAVAQVDPFTAARMAKAEKLRADLTSVDPVTRYRAREQAMQEGLTEAGNALAERARINGKQYQRIINQPEKSRYKPMTSRNIIKEKE